MPTLTVETDIGVNTRDGVKLATTLFRPAGPGRLPTVLMRTPYDRTTYASETLQVHATALAAAGYVVVLQDVRGRGASGGKFSPFVNEQSDGIDTLEWIVDQPWSNGEVGLAGISYNAFTQLALATSNHEAVKCWLPALTASDVRTSWIRRNGILDLGFHLAWALGAILPTNASAADAKKILEAFESPEETSRRGPKDQPELQSTFLADWFFEWIDSEDPYPGNDAVPTLSDIANITAPALVLAGWYDVFSSGSIELFETLQQCSSTRAHRLLAGPWDHSGLPLGRRAGDRDFGLSAAIDLHVLQLRWFDQHLRGGDEVEHDQVFVTGSNQWWHGVTWPSSTEKLTLHLTEEGSLSTERTRRGHFEVVLDSGDPTPAAGGTTFPWEPILRPGAFHQESRRSRPDVLAFSGPELSSTLIVAGSPKVEVAVEAPPGDIPVVATLVEHEPGGHVWNISDGFGLVDPASGIVSFELGPICHQFSARSRLGLDIAFAADVRLGPTVAGTRGVDLTRGPTSMTLPVVT